MEVEARGGVGSGEVGGKDKNRRERRMMDVEKRGGGGSGCGDGGERRR